MAQKTASHKEGARLARKLPVIQLSLTRLGKYCKGRASEQKIIESLPYLGLDIEDREGDSIHVEYSPNRPDFSSEAGLARSLVGLLGIETGLPKYNFQRSKFAINVEDDRIRQVRPYIQGLFAEISVTDEIITQLIAMQEDLHNGIGRRRSKVAIGIHNAAVITNSIRYHGVENPDFSFVPLGSKEELNIRDILTKTEQGTSYGSLLSDVYPMLEDSHGNVLSMPPIINGELTRLMPGISKLLVDVTGTDEGVVDVSTAIIASMLNDTGARVFSVQIVERGRDPKWTPDMTPKTMRYDLELTNEILGLSFTIEEARVALEKSRLGLDPLQNAVIPRFRSDIMHQIDLAEEVALGYGIARIEPLPVSSSLAGDLNPRLRMIDLMIDVLVGLGLTEIWNLSLTSKEQVSHCEGTQLKVNDAKSQSFEYLRCDLISSLLQVLGGSTHLEYPQRIFEQAPVFAKSEKTVSGLSENDHVAVAIADSAADYSVIRSLVDAFLRLVIDQNSSIVYRLARNTREIFAYGRTATVSLRNSDGSETELGHAGEVSPDMLERYGLEVPVIGFELDLEALLPAD